MDTDNRMANLPFYFQNQASEEGLNLPIEEKNHKKIIPEFFAAEVKLFAYFCQRSDFGVCLDSSSTLGTFKTYFCNLGQ